MTSTKTPIVPATAAEVREFVSALEGLTLSDAAAHNLSSRGRLHPEVVEAHNSRVSKGRRYVEGAKRTVALDYRRTQPSGRTVAAVAALTKREVRALAARAGVVVGARGPLSDEAIQAASEQFAREQAEALVTVEA